MKVDPRDHQLAQAQTEMSMRVLDVASAYALSDAETIFALTQSLATIAKHHVKAERE